MKRLATYCSHVWALLLLGACLGFSVKPVYAQLDTSLTYAQFLQQCVQFKQQAKPQIWVVNFWASWNGASLYSLEGLQVAHQAYRNKPVRFVSISVDKIRASWEKRLSQYNMPWEHLFLPSQDQYEFLKRAFQHNSLPAIYVVDPQGLIRRMHDTAELMEFLEREVRYLPDQPLNPQPVVDPAQPTDPQPQPAPRPQPQPEPDPQPEDPQPQPEVAEWIAHKVKRGETLYRISRTYNVSVEQIRQWNGLRSNNIQAGQTLRIKQ